MNIKCYTLTNNEVLEGIEIAKYDSIVADPCVERLDTACIHLVPVLESVREQDPNDFAKVASGSLSFICQEKDDANICQSGIILSLHPSDWALTFDKSHIVILDPAGCKNDILVYVQANTIGYIQHRKTGNILCVDKQCALSIRQTNRASMMYQALGLPALKTNLPVSSPQDSQASSRKKTSKK